MTYSSRGLYENEAVREILTFPKKIRKSLDIKEWDTLIIGETDGEIVLKKGKTIFDGTKENIIRT